VFGQGPSMRSQCCVRGSPGAFERLAEFLHARDSVRPEDAKLVTFGVPEDLPARAIVDVIGSLRSDGDCRLYGHVEVDSPEVKMKPVFHHLGLWHLKKQQSYTIGAQDGIPVVVDGHLTAKYLLPPCRQSRGIRTIDTDTIDPCFE
jgi:hypothetical protein